VFGNDRLYAQEYGVTKETSILRLVERLLDVVATIPPWMSWGMARFIGRVWFRFDLKHRAIALSNLERAWGDELDENEREIIGRKNFTHLARVILELPYLRKMTTANVDRFATFVGAEHFLAALDRGKGLLFLTSHFGNWELMALAFSLKYRPAYLVVRPLDNLLLDRLINSVRSRGGNKLIDKKGSVRRVLRLLRQGEIVALLMDQNVDWYDGVFVPFFKDIACTNKALTVMALRTGTPVVPVYNVRQPDGRYQVVFEPALALVRTGDKTRDIEENTALLNRTIESYVRRDPEQWFWVHQRWKTRPYQPWPRRV
jgi:KDO2-lipid IV(A) lauroyltransferase